MVIFYCFRIRLLFYHLGFSKLEGVSQVESFGADHVLLPLELGLQPLQLLRGEDRPHPLGLALPAAPGTVDALVFWNKLRHQSHHI